MSHTSLGSVGTRVCNDPGAGDRELVTVLGASGLIGSAVAAVLAECPIRLRLVARRPCAVPAGGRAQVEVRIADLTMPGRVAELTADSHAVVHLVAHVPEGETWRGAGIGAAGIHDDLGITLDLIEALRRGRRSDRLPAVLFAGSTSQVGLPARTFIDGTETDRPVTPYDVRKLAAEQALKAATAEGTLRGITLRLPTVFGHAPSLAVPTRGVVAAMARRALAGEPLTMWNDGAVERDLLAVDDTARAFAAALDHADALAGRHWVIGTGRPVSVATLFTSIAEIAAEVRGGAPVAVISVPPPAEATSTDLRSHTVDSSAFRAATGWRPVTPMREALRSTVIACAAGG